MPVKKTCVLVADDDLQFLKLVKLNLVSEGYDVITAHDGQQALELFNAEAPDAVILDISMPIIDGFCVCERLREFSAVPIIFATAREQPHDKITGFSLGADDYLIKPFDMSELIARLRAILRRSQAVFDRPGQSLREQVVVGDLTIRYACRQVLMLNQEVAVTPIEYTLLSYLGRHVGHVLTQHQLLEATWGSEYVGEYQMLRVNINRLRNKLEPDPAHPRYILTKTGIGYMLNSRPLTRTSHEEGQHYKDDEKAAEAAQSSHQCWKNLTRTLSARVATVIEGLFDWEERKKKVPIDKISDAHQQVEEQITHLLQSLQDARQSTPSVVLRGRNNDETSNEL